MRLVIADTGPINYLIEIGLIELLPRVFERIALPSAVQTELSSALAPQAIRRWIASPPAWLEIHDSTRLPQVSGLDQGESAAVALAESLHADILLIDERAGTRVARERGLRATGTLGFLDLAAERGFLNFAEAIRKLELTSFRRPDAVLKSLLAKHKRSERTMIAGHLAVVTDSPDEKRQSQLVVRPEGATGLYLSSEDLAAPGIAANLSVFAGIELGPYDSQVRSLVF